MEHFETTEYRAIKGVIQRMDNKTSSIRHLDRDDLITSRGHVRLVNRDEVFAIAKRLLSIYPQLLYQLVKADGVGNARLKTAFVISLFEQDYFSTTRSGEFEPSIEGQRTRARAFLQNICYAHKSIILELAGEYFFKYYPEYRKEVIRNAKPNL